MPHIDSRYNWSCLLAMIIINSYPTMNFLDKGSKYYTKIPHNGSNVI